MAAQSLTIQFHDQTLTVALIDGKPYVAMKPICENIGLQWDGQMQRIKRHPVLSSTTCITHVVAEDGKQREMLMLPLDYLNGWLFGIDAARVKPDIKDRLIDYQRECFKVLAKHFLPQLRSGSEPETPHTLPRGLTPEQQDAVKALVRELLPAQHGTLAALTDVDLAILYHLCSAGATLCKLGDEIAPILDALHSISLMNVKPCLNNQRLAVRHLTERFGAAMEHAARVHDVFIGKIDALR